jgi:hypothetical protein
VNFINEFFWQSLFASAVASIFFSLPGAMILHLLGLRWHTVSIFFVAPALGLCTYGPFSLAFTALVGYSVFTLLLSWFFFQVIILFWLSFLPTISDHETFCELSIKNALLLLGGAVIWAIIPTSNIFPTFYQGGLFINDHIFDHAKIAVVDAIAREGLLPINPYYAPNGETILLIYYYTWHFLASQLKLLANVTGWQAEVAMNWFTGFATIAFLSAVAIRVTQRALTGALLLLFALASPPADLLPFLLEPHWKNWVGYPPVHGLEVLWVQMAWVPQHVFSALALVIFIVLTTRILSHKTWQPQYALVAGLTIAAAFGSSTWVGGIGFIFVLPVLIIMALWLRLPSSHYLNTLLTALLAILICLIFSLPLLISQASGPSLAESELPFSLGLYTATGLFNKTPYWGYVGHLILFWLQFLPLCLGIIFILGSLAMIVHSPTQLETRIFQTLSIGATIGFLLVVQFLQSTFWNNTFGWRAVLVPLMLLMIWSAIALTKLSTPDSVSKWQPRFLSPRWQPMILSLVIVGLTIGILSSLRLWRWPNPSHYPPPSEVLAQHQGFFQQRLAWASVREYAGPTDKVQSNPDGYAHLTPWPATLPYALFADRATTYANREYATVFAYRYDSKEREQQYRLIKNVFSAQPTKQAIGYLHDVLKVKVLLVDKFDPVWHSTAIEASKFYDLVEVSSHYKIYVTR